MVGIEAKHKQLGRVGEIVAQANAIKLRISKPVLENFQYRLFLKKSKKAPAILICTPNTAMSST